MKEFLNSDDGVGLYENVTIDWVKGHNPDLFVYKNDGSFVKQVDLTVFKSWSDLHQLFIAEGFSRKCTNKNDCPKTELR